MKKIYIMILLVFAGMMAVGQTSVWNGDRTIWTKGSGTESDPYLLESAEHLAYFAYVVNKGFNTTGMHFLLTTDIDLNGSEDLPWVPIGLGNRWFSEDGCNRGSSSGFYDRRPFFQGHFDGGNHSVSNIYVDGWSNAGLFGWAQGTVENPTVIENVFVLSGTIAGATCGGILGKGTNTLVSHCWNGASISGTNVGGIVGEGANVLSCYNTGHVTGTANVGGIVGQSALVIEECYNSGIVEGDGQVAAGGLLGRDYPVASTINNCYNKGSVSAIGGEGSYYPAAGGLIGRQVKSCEITNCYNVGEVSGSNHVGCLIGLSSTAASVENCYYLDACTESEYGTASSGDYMRSQELVDILNSGNSDLVWALDSDGINDGFPVLLNFVSAGTNVTDGVLNGVFSVGENSTVRFSQGNLQYIGSAGNGDESNTGAYWKFADHQWDYLGDNGQGNDSKTVDRDLFGWGTSGWNNGNVYYQPWSTDYVDDWSTGYGYGPTDGSNYEYDLTGAYANADWGSNAISNGGNQENSGWRTLMQPEWDYVFNTRTMVNGGPRYTVGKRVEGVLGVVVYPDNYAGSAVSSDLTAEGWAEYEAAGCVFLPAAGFRYGTSVDDVGSGGYYWSASCRDSDDACYVYFSGSCLFASYGYSRDNGRSVRLVRPAQNCSFTINATPNPAEGGAVSGAGAYAEGTECTLTATASAGYIFVNWTENGEVVSTEPTYSFTVTGDRELVANFVSAGTNVTEGVLNGVFSVGDNSTVQFSQGNLQYKASTNTWRFAESQWDYVGTQTPKWGDPGGTVPQSDNSNISQNYNGWIDLFGWGTSGWNNGNVYYQPWSTDYVDDYNQGYGYGPTDGSNYEYDLTGAYANADWGSNAISNGGNQENSGWRTLTRDEWDYVFNTRTMVNGGPRYTVGRRVEGVLGVVVYPDNYAGSAVSSDLTSEGWAEYEAAGCVFLPAAGFRGRTSVGSVGSYGIYWSASYSGTNIAWYVDFDDSGLYTDDYYGRSNGFSVRLVRPAQNCSFTINATPNPAEGGAVSGAGAYAEGAECTLTATASAGYTFVNWTENGEVVSTEPTYSFTVTGDRELVANFVSAGSNVTDGVLNGLFSVGENTTVRFSQGNLQYIGSAGNGDENNNGAYWKFAEHQWDYLGDNGQGSDSKTVDRDLFGWGTSGYNHGANCYQPWSTSTSYSDYHVYGSYTYNLYDQSGQADWGYNAISNGGNQENSGWRTLTQPEWNYVFNTRTMVNGGPRYTLGSRVEGVLGVVVYPDNYAGSAVSSDLTAEGWAEYEAAGCVFLPAAGYRNGTSVNYVGSYGFYWSASYGNTYVAWSVDFYDSGLGADDTYYRDNGLSVRLVRSAQNYSFTINATPNPAEGGAVSGAGAYAEGAECTLTATASAGYTFVNWTENGEVVSTDPTYLFTVTGDRTLVANFELYEPFTIDYISDGLILYLDGIRNMRSGHSSNTNVWEDLVGNYDVAVTNYNSYTWEDNHFLGLGNEGYLNTGKTWQYFNSLNNDITIEIVTYIDCDRTSPEYRGIVGWHSDADGMNVQNDQGWSRMQTLGRLPVSVVDDQIATVSYTLNNGSFLDGIWRTNDNTVSNGVNSNLLVVFGNSFSSQRGWNDSIYCIRMYNRTLTPDEIAYNHSVDVERFGAGSLNTFNITASPTPAEGGTVSGFGNFIAGDNCTLTATPNDGYTFVNWTENGEVVSTDPTYLFTVTGDRELVAIFLEGNSCEITFNLFDSYGDGWNGNRLLITTDYGLTREITLDGGSSGSHTLMLVNNRHITLSWINGSWMEECSFTVCYANGNVIYSGTNLSGTSFEFDMDCEGMPAISYDINGLASPESGGTISGVGEYDYGAGCTLTATPADGYIFVNWTENGEVVSTDATYSFTVTGDRALVANFKEKSPFLFDENLVAYYPFDGDVNDYSGNGNHGTISGNGLQPTTDRFGNDNSAYLFGGYYNRGWVYVPNSSSLVFDNAMSMSFWMNISGYDGMDGWGNYTNKGWFALICKQGDRSGFNTCAGKQDDTHVHISSFNNNNSYSVYSDPVYSLGEWMHCVITIENNISRIYVNGMLLQEAINNQVDFSNANNNPMYIGIMSAGGWWYPFNGKLDDIALYNRSLSPEEVLQLYNYNEGCLPGVFSVSDNVQVCFSQGNLQYKASTNTWRFAESQWDYVGTQTPGLGDPGGTVPQSDNSYISPTYSGWIDLFGWGTSGYNHGANCYQPWSISGTYSDYYAYGNSGYNLFDQSGQADWGYNAISNGGNQENSGWRTLTRDEWDYVFNTRTMVNGGPRYTLGRRVEGVLGVIVYPDNYTGSAVSSDLTAEGWAEYEAAGCVFLPAAGNRDGTSVYVVGSDGYYWSASYNDTYFAWIVNFYDSYLYTDNYTYRDLGLSVRLVRSAQNYSFTINATPNPAEGGAVSGAGTYWAGTECTLTATPNDGYTFVNWTENGEVVSTDPTYLFTVNGDRELVANFNPQQYTAFNMGWTWYSTFVELNDINGLEMMEDGLGDHGVMIKSQQNGFVMYDLGEWMGALTSMNNESMYLINVNTPCSVVFNGVMADPAQHPITLAPGWNWIGYPSAVAADINTALANLQPHEGDVVKTQEAFSQYSDELGWTGGLNTLTPGDGLMYRSLTNQTMNFVYVTESKDGVLKKNITPEDNHFVPDLNAYPYNMSVVAVVELDNHELSDSRYELAAFVGDECRGSVKLHYVKALDRYVAFLTVAGDKAATLRWKLYDTETDKTYANDDEAVFEADAVMGGVKHPVTMRFNSVTAQTGEWLSSMKIWPNPVKADETIRIDLPSNFRHETRVEVVNALGVVMNTVTMNDKSITVKAPMVPGLYLVRVTSEEGECHGFKLIVK